MLETSREPAMRTAPSDLDIKPEPQIHIEAIPDSASDDSASDTAPQHQQELQPSNFDLHAGHLIASPYPDRANQLDLQTPDPQSRFFAFALSTLTPATPLYATATYTAAFNWSTVFSALRTLCYQQDIHWQRQECYVVIFRSKLRKGADRIRLGELDRKAHEEGCASGGLLKYWFGCANGDGRNLATCLWVSCEDAAAGGGGPWHRKARRAAREMYESMSFHTHRLVVEDDVSSWHLKDCSG